MLGEPDKLLAVPEVLPVTLPVTGPTKLVAVIIPVELILCDVTFPLPKSIPVV